MNNSPSRIKISEIQRKVDSLISLFDPDENKYNITKILEKLDNSPYRLKNNEYNKHFLYTIIRYGRFGTREGRGSIIFDYLDVLKILYAIVLRENDYSIKEIFAFLDAYSIPNYQYKHNQVAKIFISYARADKSKVEIIYKYLKKIGLQPWMDVFDLKGGEKWIYAINKAIEDSDIFIAILSNQSVNRRGILQKELKKAQNKLEGMLQSDIFIIPLRIDDAVIPDSLCELHTIEWNDGVGKDELQAAITTGLQKRIS